MQVIGRWAPAADCNVVMKIRIITITLSAAALAAAGLFLHPYLAGQSSDSVSSLSEEAPRPEVSIVRPTARAITEWDSYTGRFEALDEVRIKSRVSGYLKAIHFTDGQIVQEGDPLFTIDPRTFEAEVRVAEARVKEMEARLDVAMKEEKRSSRLAGTGALSRTTIDGNISERQQAAAALAAARAAVERAQLELDFTRITAPITGRIDRHHVDQGNLIKADLTELTSIVSLDPIHVSFHVNQNALLKYDRFHASGIRQSSRTTANPVRISLGDETVPSLEGKMDFVSNSVHRSTGTIEARAIVANPNQFLTPGLFAKVELLAREESEVLLIPDEAILTQRAERIVYLVDSTGFVEARPVTLGPLHEGMRVVRTGIAAGDRIISEGVERVQHGQLVSVDQPARTPSDLRRTEIVSAQ